MKVIFVEQLPATTKRGGYHKNKNLFMDFVESCRDFAKLEFADGEYVKLIYGYKTLYNCAKKHGYPVKVRMINGEVYLIRTHL